MHIKTQKLFGFLVFGGILLGSLGSVSAQSQSNGAAEASPTKTTVDANPGDVKVIAIQIKNIDSATSSFQPVFSNFRNSDDESGEPKVINDPAYSAGIQNWLSGSGTFSLAAGAITTYNATVTVPSNATPGTHYGLVRFTKISSTNTLTSSVGSLVFVNVGQISQNIKIESFNVTGITTDDTDITGGSFVTRVNNTANGFTIPSIKIGILDANGSLIRTLDANTDSGGILPGTIRKYTAPVPINLPAGKNYKARLLATDADNPPIAEIKDFKVPALRLANSNSSPSAKTSSSNTYLLSAIAIAVLALVGAIVLILRRHQASKTPAKFGSPQSPVTPSPSVYEPPEGPVTTPPTTIDPQDGVSDQKPQE